MKPLGCQVVPVFALLTPWRGILPSALPQDTDQDGIPDSVEEILGTRPQEPERFSTIFKREELRNPKNPARCIMTVEIANAGGNRLTWRIGFAGKYPEKNSNLILYLDSDNDIKTGREPGKHGCELMLFLRNGRSGITAFNADGSRRSASYPRVAIVGRHAYYSYDVDLKQERGVSLFRMSLLSETREPHRSVDYTGYFNAEGPPMSDRAKILLSRDLTESVGVEQTWGSGNVDAELEQEGSILLPLKWCELDGFSLDASEYRAENALRTSFPGRIIGEIPEDGKFYPAFVIHDPGAREVVGISINGKQRGVAVANWGDHNQHLFFLSSPVDLRKGDKFELKTLSSKGRYRIETLALLRNKPAPRPPLYEFRYITVKENSLTFISTWAVACTVELSTGEKIKESLAVNNHKLLLPMKKGESVRFRISAKTREDKIIQTDWHDYTWKEFKEPPTRASGRIPLRVFIPEERKLEEYPVTFGVPFPKGALGSARNVRLISREGVRVLLQTRVTARWSDGSIKWLLLDFRYAGSESRYFLEYGAHISHRRVAPENPAPPQEIGELVLVDLDGREYRAQLSRFRLEENGALRQCWYKGGAFTSSDGSRLFRYEVRVHTYPGLPWKRVLVTFTNDASKEEFTTVRSLCWHLPSLKGPKRFIRQHNDNEYLSSEGRGERWNGPVGWLWFRDFWQNYPKDIEVGDAGTIVWILPPLKRNEYAWAKGTMDEHRLFFWFDRGGYKLRQGTSKTHEVWLGRVGKVPQYDRPLVGCAPAEWYANANVFGHLTCPKPSKPLLREYDSRLSECLDGYLRNREHNREYGFMNFGDWWGERRINWGNIEYDTQHAFFLQFVRTGDVRFFRAGEEAEIHNRDIDTVHAHANKTRIGGVYAHCIGHTGNYYKKSPLPGRNVGTPEGSFTVSHTWCEGHIDHYFLTGERRSLETALKIADRFNLYETVNYDFTNCRIPGWHLILAMAVYRATGDPFHLNACRIIVERVLERQTLRPALGTAGGGWRRMMVPGHCLCTPRHYGNAGFMVGVLLTGLQWYHQETGDKRVAQSIVNGARFLVEDMWEPEVRGFRYTSCPNSRAGSWSNFLLFDAIAYAYKLTGDRTFARVLALGARPAIRSINSFGKSFTEHIRVAPHFLDTLSELIEEPVTVVADPRVEVPPPLSGRVQVVLDASHSLIPRGAKPLVRWHCGDGRRLEGIKVRHTYKKSGVYTATVAVRADGEEDSSRITFAVPPPWVLKAKRADSILVEAEGLLRHKGGRLKIPAGRVGGSGKIVTGWERHIGHWIEWKVNVPADDTYYLVFKYCTGSRLSRRSLEIDGGFPSNECKSIEFEGTGGFSVHADNWRYKVLGGQENPLPLKLRAGEHIFRISNLGGGLGLDWFALVKAPI